MKPLYQRLSPRIVEEGFTLKTIKADSFACPWHTHPEYELILVLESNGYRIVGDNIADLQPGDLVLVGPDLPHIWQNSAHGPGPQAVHAILLQFQQSLLSDGLLRLPALAHVRRLLDRAASGIHFFDTTQTAVSELMRQMQGMEPYEQFVQLLKILGILADSPHSRTLASPGLIPKSVHYDQERMNRVLEFIADHLDECVRLKDAAKVMNLSEHGFSRFFRMHTGRTFPSFVNELRIGRACRLLIETDKSVAEISYECGFGNLSNFNRQFLLTKKLSPRIFRRQMQQKSGHGDGITPTDYSIRTDALRSAAS